LGLGHLEQFLLLVAWLIVDDRQVDAVFG
jgi:hypothetical protein